MDKKRLIVVIKNGMIDIMHSNFDFQYIVVDFDAELPESKNWPTISEPYPCEAATNQTIKLSEIPSNSEILSCWPEISTSSDFKDHNWY